jgi:hypothetical protein
MPSRKYAWTASVLHVLAATNEVCYHHNQLLYLKHKDRKGSLLTPGVSTVRTTDFSKSFDIFLAPTRGVTGSAVLPMNRIGKLVFPPICEPVAVELSVHYRKVITVCNLSNLRIFLPHESSSR